MAGLEEAVKRMDDRYPLALIDRINEAIDQAHEAIRRANLGIK